MNPGSQKQALGIILSPNKQGYMVHSKISLEIQFSSDMKSTLKKDLCSTPFFYLETLVYVSDVLAPAL